MFRARYFLFFFAALAGVLTELTDEEYHRLPRLFHLDDYDRCLSQKDGLYCLGTFHLTPTRQMHPIYNLIKEYSKTPQNFNRTLARRGYCVSARCPSSERNSTLRFERCAASRARPLALRTRLHALHYCRTHQDTQRVKPPDTPQRVFLYIVFIILFLNFIGTVYDVNTGDDSKKNKLFTAWSVPSNWMHLTNLQEDGARQQSSLAPIQGARVILQAIIMIAHTCIIHHMVYLHNPEALEKLHDGPIGVLLVNGSSLVQSFVIISSFLTASNWLMVAQAQPVGVSMLLKGILKRLFRIAPVYLLVIGYAATWWPKTGDGPLWSAVVGAESAVCRRKFWTHALFINNLVEANVSCLVPTWSLAVDLQLYIVTTALTLMLLRTRSRAPSIIAMIFVASCFFNVILSYVYGWKSMLQVAVAENIRNMFRYELSHSRLHMSTWGNLPACLLGLFLAHLYFERRQKAKRKVGFAKKNEEANNISTEKKKYFNNKIKEQESTLVDESKENTKHANGEVVQKTANHQNGYNWLAFVHIYIIPVYMIWLMIGDLIKGVESQVVTAAYVGVERLVFSVLFAVQLISFLTVDGYLKRVIAWKGWQPLARMSLAVLMIHWCVGMTISVGRHQLTTTSLFHVFVDWAANVMFTYALAVPVTILVELPMQKFLDALIT